MNYSIMNPEHEKWDEFCDRLFGSEGLNFRIEDEKNSWDCECSPEMKKSKKILSEIEGIDPERSIEFFIKHEAECDCGILFNVETAYYNEKYRDKILYGFDSVLKFSKDDSVSGFLLGIFTHRIENSLKIIEIATVINHSSNFNDDEKITISKYLMDNENAEAADFLLIVHYPDNALFQLLTFNNEDGFKIITDKNISKEEVNHLISLSGV